MTDSSGIIYFTAMELIISFKAAEYTDDGTHIPSNKFIMELQRDWEVAFHNKFDPYYANKIEGHPSAMLRLTKYFEQGEETEHDLGMELINGKEDVNTSFEIEEYSKYKTVYAIGSQLHDDEDEPLFLIKDPTLEENILVFKYVPDDDDEDEEDIVRTPIDVRSMQV